MKFLLFHNVIDVEARKRRCTDSKMFSGQCGVQPNEECIADFSRIGKKVSRCGCSNEPNNMRVCSCKIC